MLLPMRAKTVVAVVGSLLLLWCSSCSGKRLPEGVSNDFFWMPAEERNARFEKYDFDSQYRIYIYGCQKIEPPAIGLAWPLARQGSRIVQPLEAKLKGADNDLTIRDIVFVFRVMKDLGMYDVVGDKPLMAELRLKVSNMKDSSWREIAENNLAAIRENSTKR